MTRLGFLMVAVCVIFAATWFITRPGKETEVSRPVARHRAARPAAKTAHAQPTFQTLLDSSPVLNRSIGESNLNSHFGDTGHLPVHAIGTAPANERLLSSEKNAHLDSTTHGRTIPRPSPALQESTVTQPAVWAHIEDSPYLTPAQQDEIQSAAIELRDKIANSGLDPASQEYRDLWIREVEQSDWMFRQRYGARAWNQHLVQSHQLSQTSQP
jgi:hypothetical protein